MHQVLERAFKLKSVKEDKKKFNTCDLVISPKGLSRFGIFDKKHLEDIFEIGYRTTNRALTKKVLHKILSQKNSSN